MTHKTHYQTAASEVAGGVLDAALWTKVNVELVGADDDVRQAKYIQLRAQELSIENAKRGIARFVPRTWWQWGLYIAVSFFVAGVTADIALYPFGWNPQRTEDVVYTVWFALLVLPLVLRKSSPS